MAPSLTTWGACVIACCGISAEATLLYSDNFNLTGPVNLDGSDQTGRHDGVFANAILTRSARQQHTIEGGQLRLTHGVGGSTRVRFHNENTLDRWDFASGDSGTAILAGQGFQVSFDWTPANNTDTNWVSWNVGINPDVVEPGLRVNDAQTDFGILFRNNGGTQTFDNAAPTTTGNFAATLTPRHVEINFAHTLFSDGSGVTANAFVDGTQVLNNFAFQWDNNAGVIHFELGTLTDGTRIDNLAISSVPEPGMLSLGAFGLFPLGRSRHFRAK